jgi:glycine/D-amino acid oxidase-like deaminating enzyme
VGSEAVIVGAGVVGLSVAHELSRAGHRVTVVSADVPGSRQSAGLTRIFRLAHADGALTQAAADSLALWEGWEREAGGPLLDRAGLLLTGDMADREIHLAAHGGVQRGTGDRHPLAVALERWAFEPTGAAIRAEDTIRFLQADLSLVLGEVAGADRDGVTLQGGERIGGDIVVVCAGPDTYRLLGVPEPERMRSVRFSFAHRKPPALPVPCWINRDETLCEPFYAVPDGPDHYSVGLSGSAPASVPEAAHIRESHGRVVSLVRQVFPELQPIAERAIACEYSLRASAPSPAHAHDGWDVLEQGGVLGVTGPALFKFAPLLGRLLTGRVDRAGDGT